MATIDADAHVVESDRTWDFMEPSDQKYRPVCVYPQGEDSRGLWIVDGRVRGLAKFPITARKYEEFAERSGRNVVAPLEAREMENIDVRLQHMSQLGIDIQVLHSTIFISQVADRPEVEVPICWGWNRWMADVWKQGEGRLRWSTVLPLLSIPHALDQLRFATEHGAVAVFVRPIEGHRVLHDPYFFPVYEEASRLNVPVVIHVGNGNPQVQQLLSQYASIPSGVWPLSVQTIGAFHAWAMNAMPEQFPQLRFGVVECTASWLPYVLNDWKRRFPTFGRKIDLDNPMKDYRMYVACQTDDDISYLVQQGCEDNLMIGTDYGHTDQSSEIEAIRNLQSKGSIEPRVVSKILDDNPRAFYGL